METKADLINSLEQLAGRIRAAVETEGPRPLFIEFSGTPKSGKTTVVNGLSLFLRRNDFTVETIVERASTCPISNKRHMYFNIWTANATLNAMLAAQERDVDVIVMDRGIYDAMTWMKVLETIGRLRADEFSAIKSYLLLPRWRHLMDIVFVMTVDPSEALEREHKQLLTQKQGSIMNETVLQQFNKAIEEAATELKPFFKEVIHIDTSKSDVVSTSAKVVRAVLTSLTGLLDETIMVLPEQCVDNLDPNRVLTATPSLVARYEEKVKSHGNKKLRSEAERTDGFVQLIVCTMFMWNGKVLLLRKREKLKDARFHGKYMIWVGGHVHALDINCEEGPFLGCLRREMAEELMFTAACRPVPIGVLWDRGNPKSKRHLGFLYVVEIDTADVARTLQSQGEFFEYRGRSISCSFIDPQQAKDMRFSGGGMESWSRSIFRGYFGVTSVGGEDFLWDE